MIPKPQRDEQGRIQGEFYPLQKAELIALRKTKLINNSAFVHLALRYENPFCDRLITVIPKEFALRWQMPESSIYEAIAKLKDSHAINIRSGRVTIEWANSQQDKSNDSQQEDNSENPESFWDSRNDSENPEKILESQKKLRNPRKNSGSPENRRSKPASDKDSSALQTIQTYSNFIKTLSEGERENFLDFGKKKAAQLPKPPELPLKWIETNFEELRSQWEKQNGVVRCTKNWESDPKSLEWLDKIRSLGFAAFIYEDGRLNKERKEFYEWANSKNLIWEKKS